MILIDSERVEEQIKLLEVMIVPQSELAYLLDSSDNYELSYTHHKFCVEVIDRIRVLRKALPRRPFSFEPYTDKILG